MQSAILTTYFAKVWALCQKINLETQAPPGFYTPDVKTSCLAISAHISNLRSVCLKLLYFKNNVVWTNRILLEEANLVLFISGGMNEAPLGYPGSAGHWAQIPALLCSPMKGSLCVQSSWFSALYSLIELCHQWPALPLGLSTLELTGLLIIFHCEHTVGLEDTPVKFTFFVFVFFKPQSLWCFVTVALGN